jgi:hypothetical protein
MNDLEDRLRDSLRDLAEPVHARVDLDELVTDGDRLRRSRRNRWIVPGVVAVVLALIAVSPAFSILTRGTILAPVVPAAPATSTGLTESAFFVVYGIGLPSPTERLRVDAKAVGTGWDVVITGSRSDGRVVSQQTEHLDAAPASIQLAPQVFVELLPARPAWWTFVQKGKGPTRSEAATVGTLNLTAILLAYPTPALPEGIAGFIWGEPDGTIRDSLGNTVPTADIVLATQTFKMYWDASLDVLNFASPEGQVITMGTKPEPDPYPRFLGQFSGAASQEGGTVVFGDVLPEGASGLDVTLSSPGAEWGQTQLAGRTVYVASLPLEMTGPDNPIASLAYTDASGQRVTVRVP